MKFYSVIMIVLITSGLAQAKTWECNDQRDSDYTVKMNFKSGAVKVYKLGKVVEKLKGKFTDCYSVGPEVGSIYDETTCGYILNGEEKSVGSLTIREGGYAYYNMNLMDRNFRGSCN